MESCYKDILNTQKGKSKGNPQFQMIVLKTPKGWTGIKELKGEKIEGNYLSHQVIAKNAKSDAVELESLNGGKRKVILRKHRSIAGEKNVLFEIVQKGIKEIK